MKTQKNSRRLRLSKETLRVMSSGELAAVNGAIYSKNPEEDYQCARDISALPTSECYVCGPSPTYASTCGPLSQCGPCQ